MGDANKTKKIALYSPYLDILGGGERFLLSVAEYLSYKNQVVLFWQEKKIIKDSEKKLKINLAKVKIQKINKTRFNLLRRLIEYDRFFHMTDGSIIFAPCSKNYLIIQSPAHIPQNNFVNRMKMARYDAIVVYSQFVKNYVSQKWKTKAIVIPPPVLTDIFTGGNKEKIIISVGRFFPFLHSKKQDVLIEAFKKLYLVENYQDWQLVLIGSIDKGSEEYFFKIKKLARGYPIKIIANADINSLKKYYQKASIYWHAAGYGENLEKYPERAEHFGITTVEAMSAGCVPVVYAGGGQKEIVSENKNGFLWTDFSELIFKTKQLIDKSQLLFKCSRQARKDSLKYAKKEFIKKINRLI